MESGRDRPKPMPVRILALLAVLGFAAISFGDATEAGGSNRSSDRTAVPNVVGMSESQAVAALEKAGLQKDSLLVTSQSVPEQEVISESPVAGSRVARKSFVVLTISLGTTNPLIPPSTSSTTTPPTVAVPNVVGLSSTQASAELSKAGFGSYFPGDVDRTVISQSPPPNTMAREGTSVIMKTSNRKPSADGPIPPTCRYLTKARAEALLGTRNVLSLTPTSSQCSYEVPAFPTARGSSPSAAIQIDVSTSSELMQTVRTELDPNSTLPSLPKEFPTVTKHLAQLEGTPIAYIASGNPDHATLASGGYSLPGVSVYSTRAGAAVVVSVSGHTHPLALGEKILAIVFDRI